MIRRSTLVLKRSRQYMGAGQFAAAAALPPYKAGPRPRAGVALSLATPAANSAGHMADAEAAVCVSGIVQGGGW